MSTLVFQKSKMCVAYMKKSRPLARCALKKVVSLLNNFRISERTRLVMVFDQRARVIGLRKNYPWDATAALIIPLRKEAFKLADT